MPSEGTIKINSDGALSVEERAAGGGGVARDNSNFLGAWCKVYPRLSNPLTIEALTLRDAVFFAVERQYSRVLFEVDCAELVRVWSEGRRDRSVISPILDDIRELGQSFQSFSIQFVRREANQSAHNCAKFACNNVTSQVWLGASPQFLVHSLQADSNSMSLS